MNHWHLTARAVTGPGHENSNKVACAISKGSDQFLRLKGGYTDSSESCVDPEKLSEGVQL